MKPLSLWVVLLAFALAPLARANLVGAEQWTANATILIELRKAHAPAKDFVENASDYQKKLFSIYQNKEGKLTEEMRVRFLLMLYFNNKLLSQFTQEKRTELGEPAFKELAGQIMATNKYLYDLVHSHDPRIQNLLPLELTGYANSFGTVKELRLRTL